MDGGLGHGIHDWSEEGIDEEEEPLALRRRSARARARARSRSPSPSPDLAPIRIFGARLPSPPPGLRPSGIFGVRSPSPPPGLRPSGIFGARSPSSARGLQPRGILWARSPSPPPGFRPRPVAHSMRTHRGSPRSPVSPAAAGSGGSGGASGVSDGEGGPAESSGRGRVEKTVAHSVRTRRSPPRLPVSPAAAGGGSSGGAGGVADGDPDGVEETVSSLRDRSARPRLSPPPGASTSSASITGGRQEEEVVVEGEFSFPPLEMAPNVVDAAEVLDNFTAPETPRTVTARGEFLQATMGATAGARTEEIKKDLLLNRRVVDLAGLERWLRRVEAIAELAWFADLCSDEEKEVPPLELFECAFRALDAARSDELHRGPDARRFWIGSVAVPEFFLCPVSKKVMENPVVITTGKTVDRSALEKWWNKHNRICPITGEVLTHSIFIPNILIALCISRWRVANSIRDLTTATHPPSISRKEEALFKKVTLLAHSPSSSKEAYNAMLHLHELVDKEQCSVRHLIGHSPGTIAKLACVLIETCLDPDPELDDIILKIIAKAASYSPNKEIFGDDQYAIPVLIARALLGPVPTRAKCAQILGLLADNYYNKIKIGELGGFAALMELLLVGDIDVKRTVAVALASLCEAQENWSRFVREGVADAAISLMRDDGLVDEAGSILLQAEGFELAMVEIMEKLVSFGGDEMCKKMVDRLWLTFIRSKPGRSRRTGSSSEASSSSSSFSEGSMEESAEQIKKDVEAIVSWLQKRTYYPRTYMYRD